MSVLNNRAEPQGIGQAAMLEHCKNLYYIL